MLREKRLAKLLLALILIALLYLSIFCFKKHFKGAGINDNGSGAMTLLEIAKVAVSSRFVLLFISSKFIE